MGMWKKARQVRREDSQGMKGKEANLIVHPFDYYYMIVPQNLKQTG